MPKRKQNQQHGTGRVMHRSIGATTPDALNPLGQEIRKSLNKRQENREWKNRSGEVKSYIDPSIIKPPTEKQLRYLEHLVNETRTPCKTPTSQADASRKISFLQSLL